MSFKVSNIVSNPRNAAITALNLINPYGNTYYAGLVGDNVVRFKNVRWRQSSSKPNACTFDLRLCGMSFTLSEFMITPANTSDGVFEPYCGSINTLENPSGGNMYYYGGSRDCATGESYCTHVCYKMGTSYLFANANCNESIINGYLTDNRKVTNVYCNRLPSMSSGGLVAGTLRWLNATTGGRAYVIIENNSGITEIADAKAAINAWVTENPTDIIMVYQTPKQTSSITPIPITPVRGINHIWTNVNGNIELSYWKH